MARGHRRGLAIALVLLCVGGGVAGWLWLRREGGQRRGGGASAGAVDAGISGTGGQATTGGVVDAPTAKARAREQARARRDALAALIEQAGAASAAASASAQVEAPLAPRAPGNLRDRVGGREALVGFLNQDFMPLAQECIELAQRANPALAGMLALQVDTIADDELGAVVERAEAAPGNQVGDPALLECIRESALSLVFQPPLTSGREKFELTIPIDPVADGGSR